MAISSDAIASLTPATASAVYKDESPYSRGSLDADSERESQSESLATVDSSAPSSAPVPEIPALFEEISPASPDAVHFPTRASFINGINQTRRKRAASHAPTRSTPRQPSDEEHAYVRRASLPVFFSSSLAAKAAEEPEATENSSRFEEDPTERSGVSDVQADAAPQRHSESAASEKPSRRGRFFRSIFGKH